MAEIYDKGPGDKTLILGIREWYICPFQATNWLDLRVGAFLSVTDATNDDLTTGLAETISISPRPNLPVPAERFWIGVKTHDTVMPTGAGTAFCGFTNAYFAGSQDEGDSVLASSDAGVGTTNTNFWRPCNVLNNIWTALMLDGSTGRAWSLSGLPVHFPQNAGTVAAGYAVLLAIQLLRPTAESKVITVKIKSAAGNADMLYTNTPTNDLLHSSLSAWPTGVQTLGPVTLSVVPDALYFYWPFHRSRLRIHAYGIEDATLT